MCNQLTNCSVMQNSQAILRQRNQAVYRRTMLRECHVFYEYIHPFNSLLPFVLTVYYSLQNRQATVGQRAKANRSAEQTMTVAGPEGNTEWEKAVNLINFGFSRPSGTDLSRFKNVLFSAKSNNVPITVKK